MEDTVGYADEHLTPLVDAGLGSSARLLDSNDGRALAVDASRDPRALRAAVGRRDPAVFGGGPADWAAATGRGPEYGA
ncbi:hypothetical protein [Streptomyces fradiae]|uniref:hypothetical protein n=1 Tax=Streptomyces fradiae TaxID=1906 RepID=UPI003985C419